MTTDIDIGLFKEVSSGNKGAFDILFRKYYTKLTRFAMGYIYDGSTAEEIVQDVFVKIWETASNIEIENSVQAYLYRSTRNFCLNYLKHEAVKKKYEEEQSKNHTPEYENYEDSVNIPLFKNLLAQAVADLPVKCREIFEMAKFEGLAYDEIAEFLNVSGKTVENQMGIALKKIREILLPHMSKVYNE